MNNFEFQNLEMLYLLFIIPLMIIWHFWQARQSNATFTIATTSVFKKYNGIKPLLANSLWILRIIAVAALILAIARPQSSDLKNKKISTEGIDIMLAMDVSHSMLADDFKPNRLKASKNVAADFIDGRYNDRIGLVIFYSEGFTQCPLTSDHAVLKGLMSEVNENTLPQGGTAIGMGLATAVARIKDSEAKSKVIILLTDGENLAGSIDPLTAAELAKTYNIRTYTIGVGRKGWANVPYAIDRRGDYVMQKQQVKIDEALLQNIADITGGKYFRATNNDSLTAIYDEIDRMEKTKLQELNYRKYHDEFYPFVLLALMLIALESILKYTYFRSIL
jgi:Ca-activated chloride channel family protein